MDEQTRVLILGTDAYRVQRKELLVVSKRWDEVDRSVNIRDHDVLVVNLLSVDDPRAVDWCEVSQQLNRQEVIGLLMSGGGVIVLGDPRFFWQSGESGSQQIDAPGGRVDFLDWSGIVFDWDGASGTSGGPTVSLDNVPAPFRTYLQSIGRWEYSLRKATTAIPTASIDEDLRASVNVRPYWQNRYDQSIVFSCTIEFSGSGYRTERYGPIIFLPRAGVTEAETIDAALSLAQVELETPEPEWLTDVRAPGQRAIDERLKGVQTRLREVWEEWQQTGAERDERRRLLGLLYEKELALEPLIRDALGELGAEVMDPSEDDREDGWIRVRLGDDVLEGVLEVKSTRSETFDEQGLRQLEEWKLNGEQQGKDYKGIFVGSRDIGRPVHSRRDDPFSSGWKRSATKRDNVGVLTEALYAALALHAESKLDVEAFWRGLFEAKGPLDPRPLLEQFAAEFPEDSQALFVKPE